MIDAITETQIETIEENKLIGYNSVGVEKNLHAKKIRKLIYKICKFSNEIFTLNGKCYLSELFSLLIKVLAIMLSTATLISILMIIIGKSFIFIFLCHLNRLTILFRIFNFTHYTIIF